MLRTNRTRRYPLINYSDGACDRHMTFLIYQISLQIKDMLNLKKRLQTLVDLKDGI